MVTEMKICKELSIMSMETLDPLGWGQLGPQRLDWQDLRR